MTGQTMQGGSFSLDAQAAAASRTGAQESAVGASTKGFRTVVFLIWLLSLAAYAPPDRIAPLAVGELDLLAIAKVLTRLIAIFLLGIAIFRIPAGDAKTRTLRCLIPFGIFATWCIISTIWSPLKAVSLGHAGELAMLVLLAAVSGIVCTDERALSRVFFHLAAAMFVVGFLSVVMPHVGPAGDVGAFTGVPRPRAFVHPNLAAQAAGGGLLIVLAGYLVWRWRWAHRLLWPSVVLALYLLFSAHSRTAIAATLGAVAACLYFLGRRRLLLIVSLLCVTAVVLYLTFDPYGDALGRASVGTVQYSLRGQTAGQFISASGRMEMWAIGLKSFRLSPVIGHGNWIMTPTGMAFVWGEEQWQTLHNLVLHVLAGTGLVGGVLLLWALARAIKTTLRGYELARLKALPTFMLVIFAWFLAIGMYELSFLGPVSPVSIFFFVTVGIAAARW